IHEQLRQQQPRRIPEPATAIHVQLHRWRLGIDEYFALFRAVNRPFQLVMKITEFIANKHGLAMVTDMAVVVVYRLFLPARPVMLAVSTMLGNDHFTPGPVMVGMHRD